MKKNKKTVFYQVLGIMILVLISLSSIQACGGDTPKGQRPDTSENHGNAYAKIKAIFPRQLPSGGLFTVTVKAGFFNLSSAPASIIIKKYLGDTCLAKYDYAFTVNNNVPKELSYNTFEFNSNCSNPGYQYRIKFYLNNLDSLFSIDYISWGSLNQNLLEPGLVFRRMTSNPTLEYENIFTSIGKTFNNSSDDSNLVHVLPDFWKGGNPYSPDSSFVITDNRVLYLLVKLRNYCKAYRPTDTTNFPYYLCYADTFHFYDPLIATNNYNVLGISMNRKFGLYNDTLFHDTSYNFSYIFRRNIRKAYPGITFQSAYNQVAVHELLHQMGNIYGGHENHTGTYWRRCALNSSDIFYNTSFQQLTEFYRVCDIHINQLRENLGGANLNTIGGFDEKGKAHKNNDRDGLTFDIEARKQTYKLFEPVVVKAKVINNSKDTLKFFDEFNEQISDMDIITIDENQQKYNNNFLGEVFTRSYKNPKILIHPFETLYVAMKVNNWGKGIQLFEEDEHKMLVPQKDNDSYFGQFGYFPIGTYKLHMELPRFGHFKSNEINFEVAELTLDDKELLKLLKDNKADNAISTYPNNSFIEHIFADQIYGSIRHFDLDKPTSSEKEQMKQLFVKFFELFPQSFYLYKTNFLYSLMKSVQVNNESFSRIKTKIKEVLKNTSVTKYLQNSIQVRQMKKVLNK